MRIPVSSPYIEVRMNTFGPYALIKERTDTSGIYTPTRHTGHTHTLNVTYTIDQHSLQAYFTRPIYTTRTRFTKRTLRAYNLRPPPTRTINASKLRVQSMRPTYAYNLRLSLARTCYAYNLRARPTRYVT